MSAWRKYPVFSAVMALLGILLAAEFVGLRQSWLAQRGSRRRLEQANRELRALVKQRPAPTPEIAGQIAEEAARAAATLAAWKANLLPAGPAAARLDRASEFSHRPEAFFELATFVETMRDRAAGAGMLLQPQERFGFSTFAHEAPDSGRLAEVLRERRMVQYLLDALIDAQPHQLLSVQRERPGEQPASPTSLANSAATRPGAPAGMVGKDYFELDPRISLRVPGIVETTAFQISFTGHTAVLRRFLNKLAEFEVPVLVRSVDVTAEERPAGKPEPSGPAPLVGAGWSRFVVTVEFVALASPAAPAF